MTDMRIGDGNAFFLMADSIDLFLLRADWSIAYKPLWLLLGIQFVALVFLCEWEVENSDL